MTNAIRDLRVITSIQTEAEKAINRLQQLMPLDPEGKKLAEGKRFTFDTIAIPVDPLR